MLINSTELTGYKDQVGAKTWNLKVLKELGLPVPAFFALPYPTIINLNKDQKLVASLTQETLKLSSASSFAVRSSALIEDTNTSSYAGQFLTKISVQAKDLPLAVMELISDAAKKLNGNLSLFSIIIQEYIQADLAGVCFTRNPLGGREMIIEYHAGIGEDVVAGKIKPKKIKIFWNQPLPTLPHKQLAGLVNFFKKIESHFKNPQDIEWLIQNGQAWLLQTRPVTNLSSEQYQQQQYLDSVLPTEEFLYEKTEISEIAPRPTPFTLDLLNKIYAKNGPVQNVYKKYGISYEPQEFLQIVGNEIYSNRQQELKTLLPAYSYFPTGKPHLASLKGLWVTIKNILGLGNLKPPGDLFTKVEQLLRDDLPADSAIIENFLDAYSIIFEVNLFAGKALQKLDGMSKKESISTAQALQLPVSKNIPNLNLPNVSWLGNSLEISDESAFVHKQEVADLTKSPENFSKLKQQFFAPLINEAQYFSRLREYGRWLTVKYIHHIRQYLLAGPGKNLKNPKDIYFSKVGETVSQVLLLERKKQYEMYNAFTLPPLLSNINMVSEKSIQCLSSGSAQGIIKSVNQITKADKGIILYTKILSPDLVKYFPQISGIVSEQGGLLSHLAIMAREHSIPVVVTNIPVALGKTVFFDADKEELKIIK
ncbi:MAG TPA: PEP/pyruvate-binding domain-containing protein [Candidatus Limnocylindria bacterium]|nr:PEP/pyruvate-binding domain-containing protein [Candidatus Limnocylindria bacterium]